MKVGLTGGLACGKTFAGNALEALGAHLIRADELGHRTLEPGGEAFEPVVQEFGREILNDDGFIDRKRLAARVFQNPECLEKLNAIVHPAVRRLQESMEREFRTDDPNGIVVTEAAILIETGSYKDYDRIILVSCGEDQQIERALARGSTLDDVQARLRRQLPVEIKRQHAHYVIDTSGEKEDTLREVGRIWGVLKQDAEKLRAAPSGSMLGRRSGT